MYRSDEHLRAYAELVSGIPRISSETTKEFLGYKKSKIEALERMERNRLEDIKHGRDTVFKYALPASFLETAIGAFVTLLSNDIAFILPVVLLILLTFSLAYHLDLRKTRERLDVVHATEMQLADIRIQEKALLLASET